MEDFIPTHGSSRKSFVQKDFVCVTYKQPGQKRKNTACKENTANDSKDAKQIRESKEKDLKQQQDKEMKAARYDVIKYGMSGFEKPKAQAAKIDLAISLGAKPPKNKMINYKQLKIMKKNAKEETKDEKVSGFKNSLSKNIKKVNKKSPIKILSSYGTINTKKFVKRKSL